MQSEEFQDLEVVGKTGKGRAKAVSKLYQQVALNVATLWNVNGNVGVVAGATYPEEAQKIRQIVGDATPILVPGVGAQGQTVDVIVPGVMNLGQLGLISSSRAIIFPKRLEGESLPDAIGRSALKTHREIVTAQSV